MTRLGAVYDDDAQHVADEDWLEDAHLDFSAVLTKDRDIFQSNRYQRARVPIFSLSEQEMLIGAAAARFNDHRQAIWRAARRATSVGFYFVYEHGVRRENW